MPDQEQDQSVFDPPEYSGALELDVFMVSNIQRTLSIPNDLAAKGTEVHCIMEEDEEEDEDL
jgi:hypothetical protein